MHELYIVTVVVGVDRLRSRKIEDIVDNYGDNVAVAPYIVGLVDNVPLRERIVELLGQGRACRGMSRSVVVVEHELHVDLVPHKSEPLVLIALYRLFRVAPERSAERRRHIYIVNIVPEAVQPVSGGMLRGRCRQLADCGQKVFVLDIALVAVVEVVPRSVDEVPVIAYLYGIPRVTESRARGQLRRDSDLIHEHCVEIGVALADRHAVLEHTVCGELLAVGTRHLTQHSGIVIVEVRGDVLVEVERLLLVRPARLHGSGDVVKHSLVFGAFRLILAVLKAVVYLDSVCHRIITYRIIERTYADLEAAAHVVVYRDEGINIIVCHVKSRSTVADQRLMCRNSTVGSLRSLGALLGCQSTNSPDEGEVGHLGRLGGAGHRSRQRHFHRGDTYRRGSSRQFFQRFCHFHAFHPFSTSGAIQHFQHKIVPI